MALLITKKAINRFEEKLLSKNITLNVTVACYKWLAAKGLSSTFGAREILRVVQDKIKTHYVDEVLFGKLSSGGYSTIDIVNNEVVFIDKSLDAIE
jgi:ATP-dependent Clp protease ATP-binding subunit ClpA